MDRRTVLSIAGGLVSIPVVGARADVLGSAASQPTASPLKSPEEHALDSFDPDSVQAEIELGNREEVAQETLNQPHEVAVWNTTATCVPVEVRVSDAAGERPSFEMSYAIPADDAVVVALLEPSDYDVVIRASVEEAEASMTIPRSRFDCNDSTTQVGVFEDGTVKSRVVTTLSYCTEAPVTDLPDDVNVSVSSDS